MKISKCVNCKEKPVIKESDDPDYKFMLTHKNIYSCDPSFRLISYQDTKKECVDDWNEFNTKSRRGD